MRGQAGWIVAMDREGLGQLGGGSCYASGSTAASGLDEALLPATDNDGLTAAFIASVPDGNTARATPAGREAGRIAARSEVRWFHQIHHLT